MPKKYDGSWVLTDEQKALAEGNMPLVTMVIMRQLPALIDKWDYEEMYQYGSIGLCKATREWDKEKGAFSTIAVAFIRNEILYEFRRMNWVKRGRNAKTYSLDFCNENGMCLADTIPDAEDTESLYDVLQIKRFIETQPPKRRLVLERRAFGCNDRTIAEETGMHYQSVGVMRKTAQRQYYIMNKVCE